MRILQIGKFYPPQRGGMETVLAELCQALVVRGHELEVVVASKDDDSHSDRIGGVLVHRVAQWGTVASVPVCPSMPAKVREVIRRFRPDVVQLHLPHPVGVLAWQSARSRVPLVVSYHSDIVRQRWLGRLWSPVRARTLRAASVIHVTHQALADNSRSLAPVRDKCRVIPLGVDVARWSHPDPARVQTWIDELGPRFVLFVGRLVYYKGIDVLLEAVRETTLPIVLAGDGPMRAEWETLSRVLGVADQVRFLGEVSAQSLPALYAAASSFVLPSNAASEAFGVVQLEAMAAGLPMVVCRASDGVASVHVEGETAILVPPNDPEALREALVAVHEDREVATAMGRAAHQRVKAFYDIDRVHDRFEDLLLTAAGRSTAQ